jgi:hypothetical protein
MDQSPLISRECIRATPVATLRRFAGARQVGAAVREYCDVCRAPIAAEEHHDLLDLRFHRMTCACDACAQQLESAPKDRYAFIPRGENVDDLKDHFVEVHHD